MNKKILLIGGNGTLGTYTAKELSEMGHSLDIICLEDNQADTEPCFSDQRDFLRSLRISLNFHLPIGYNFRQLPAVLHNDLYQRDT